MRARQVARLAGIDIKTFKIYNRDLKGAIRKNIMLPKGLEIHLPMGHKKRLNKKLSKTNRKRRYTKNKKIRRKNKRKI